MMETAYQQPSWPFYSVINSTFDQVEEYDINMDSCMDVSEFSSSFTTTETSSGISCIQDFPILTSDFADFPAYDDSLPVVLPVENFLQDLEGFEHILSGTIDGMFGFLEESEGSFPSEEVFTESEDIWSPGQSMKSSEVSMDGTEMQSSLTLPGEDMEVDNQKSILHLLRAYGEALENEQRELAEVILGCLNQKVSPFGQTLERLAYNLSQDVNKQSDYLRQESCKNFEAAFKAFYQIFPYGKFAHFAANSAILDAIPQDTETIHIVDFDMGEGIQWPPVIEAIARQRRALKLTSIKWGEDYDCAAPSWWRFEQTKTRLKNHARSFGLELKVEEINIEDLVSEIKKMKKRDGGREFLTFNCMLGLPHMGRERSRRLSMEFLKVAKELMVTSNSSNRGIITFGDGDGYENLKNCTNFNSFFDGYLTHYEALLESINSTFPAQLAEARLAIECLFVAPHISSHAWLQKWKDRRDVCNLQAGMGLEACRVSKETLMEARELVKERESLYGVRIGQQENEMLLEWRGTPLVRVSTWRKQS